MRECERQKESKEDMMNEKKRKPTRENTASLADTAELHLHAVYKSNRLIERPREIGLVLHQHVAVHLLINISHQIRNTRRNVSCLQHAKDEEKIERERSVDERDDHELVKLWVRSMDYGGCTPL